MTPANLTLRARLARATIVPVLAVGGAAAGFALAPSATMADTEAPVGAERVVLDALLEEHGDTCWQGGRSVLPGAAIVRMRDGRIVYTERPALVSEAFDDALTAAGLHDAPSVRLDTLYLCE